MKSTLPTGKNPLTALQEFLVSSYNFRQILDFGRYTVRIDTETGRGYFKSNIDVGNFVGTLHFQGKLLISASAELPLQVKIALERAGYTFSVLSAIGS